MSRSIALDEYLPHAPAQVWRALTEPELLARWLMPPTDFQLKVGHRFTFQGTPVPRVQFSGIVRCEVLSFEVERSLCYSWVDHSGENDLRSIVTWRLEPEGQGTHLFLVHDGFDPEHPLQQLSYQIMSGGWGRLMRQLVELFAAEDAMPTSPGQ